MTTDEPDEQLDPASPEDEARIRALLSGARETGPMPAAVVARLDGALVGLAAERVTVDPVPADNVIPITRTRRHRVVAVLGVAAAIAVIGGLGFSAFQDTGSDDSLGEDGDAGSVVERGDDDSNAANDVPSADREEEAGGETDPSISPDESYIQGDQPYVVRPRSLTRDLARIQDRVIAVDADDTADYAQGLVYAPKDFSCRLAPTGRGVLVGVRYDGGPAFVRFLPPMGDSQVVEVVQCRTGDLLRSTTLPTDD
jgi:hypothetical protein